jgi:hypothetical protein
MGTNTRAPRALAALYAVALVVLALTAVVRAEWPYGCCEQAASECAGDTWCADLQGDCSCGIFSCEENYCKPVDLD